MFSKETIVLDVEPDLLHDGDVDLFVKLFQGLTAKPAAARAKRSAFVVTFEGAGIKGLSHDPVARRYVKAVADAVPYIGYYLNGDAPMFHLRKFSMALAQASGELSFDSFLEAHGRLHHSAVSYCASVGDDDRAITAIFEANLPHEMLQEDATLQARAMRELHPVLLMALSASPELLATSFREAEGIWGRKVGEFGSREAFVTQFEKSFRAELARQG